MKALVQQYSDVLIDRVKERIDDVKVEILQTFQGIVKASLEVSTNTIEMDLMAQSSLMRQLSIGDDLKGKQAQIIKALRKPMQSKNMKVKVAAIDTLSEFTQLVQFNIDKNFEELWPELEKTIDDRQSFEPTISSLGVLRRLFRAKKLDEAGPVNFTRHAGEITEFLKQAV